MRTQVLVKHYLYKDLTDACLESLTKQEFPLDKMESNDFKVTIIDSSPEGTYKYKNNVAQKIDNSVGLIESFNRFLDPEADIYLCMNNDTYAHSKYVWYMTEALSEPTIGIAAPLYDQVGGGILEFACPYLPSDKEWDKWLDNNLPQETVDTKHVDNCAWGFSKKLVEIIGLPDGNFPGAGWGANLDYCYRARNVGFRVIANGYAFVHHNHRATYGKDPNYVANAQRERDEYLTKKYGNASKVW